MNVSPDDPTPVYGWQIRGLQGVVNLLEAMTTDGIRFSDHFRRELEEATRSLNEIVDMQNQLQ